MADLQNAREDRQGGTFHDDDANQKPGAPALAQQPGRTPRGAISHFAAAPLLGYAEANRTAQLGERHDRG